MDREEGEREEREERKKRDRKRKETMWRYNAEAVLRSRMTRLARVHSGMRQVGG